MESGHCEIRVKKKQIWVQNLNCVGLVFHCIQLCALSYVQSLIAVVNSQKIVSQVPGDGGGTQNKCLPMGKICVLFRK